MNSSIFQDIGFWAILSFGTIIVIAIISFTLVAIVGYRKDAEHMSMAMTIIFQGGNSLRIATVVLIILTTTTLAILDILKENGIVAILSAIVGYVLGSMEKVKDIPASSQSRSADS